MLKICFVDVLGLPFDGSTLEKQGLGGSESAIISMSRELSKIGFEVTVFNDCLSNGCKESFIDGVHYLSLDNINNNDEDYDIMIASRSVSPLCGSNHNYTDTIGNPIDFDMLSNRSKRKVLWMHDTFCEGDDLIENLILEKKLDEIFTLSDFHTSYVTNCSHGRKRNFEVLKKYIFQTRNGINKHIDWVDISKKDPDHFVYNASVSKGMVPLLENIWPKVKKKIPSAKLTIIGGYYNFKEGSDPDEQEIKWKNLANLQHDGVTFTGVITQQEISKILADASYTIYPAAFPETFGISSLESLYHNTPIITCEFGALEETAIDSACYKIPYAIEPNSLFPHINANYQESAFIDLVLDAYNNKYLHQQKMYACNKVKDVCGWETVALQWKQHFYRVFDIYLDVDEYRKVSEINHEVSRIFGRRFSNKEDQSIKKSVQHRIVIVSPTYNAGSYLKRCIESVKAQDYNRYLHIVIDDGSTDGSTENLVSTDHLKIIKKKHSGSALKNQVQTISDECKPGDIVILLDGDDRLVNDPNILHRINNEYHKGIHFTYGSCWSDADNIPLIAQEYPPEVKENKSYRNYKFNWNIPYTHLRTFLATYLFSSDIDKFKDESGDWLKAGGDTALFYTIIEQIEADKIKAISEVICHYNDKNPINDYKVNSEEQTRNANYVMSSKKNKKILIAIPTDKNIEAETYKSIYNLSVPKGYETYFQYFYGYRIDQIRNLIVDWSINNEFDYVFCVDHDIVFEKDTLEKLISHDVDIVSGIYRQRLEKQTLEIYDKSYRNVDSFDRDTGLLEIGACGFGCVLINISLLKKMKYPHFEYHHSIDHNNTISEDVDFCRKAAEYTKIYADTSVVCGHIGQKLFEIKNM